MSLNVLIIAEDYRNDQYILKPIVNSMLETIGRPHANVRVCKDPMIGGVEDALAPDTIEDVISTNPLFDLYLLLVDRDADPNRHERLEEAEHTAGEYMRPAQAFFGGQAHQEVEVWLLAGQEDLPTPLGTRRRVSARRPTLPFAAGRRSGGRRFLLRGRRS